MKVPEGPTQQHEWMKGGDEAGSLTHDCLAAAIKLNKHSSKMLD